MARLTHRRDAAGRVTEVPPDVLDCGHPLRAGEVTVGYDSHPVHQVRVRTYYCRRCNATTYTEPAAP